MGARWESQDLIWNDNTYHMHMERTLAVIDANTRAAPILPIATRSCSCNQVRHLDQLVLYEVNLQVSDFPQSTKSRLERCQHTFR